MSQMIAFELRQPSKRIRRLQCKRRLITIIFFIMMFSATSAGFAGDDERAKSNNFYYQAYSEAEIKAVVQRPLTLNDCIRIALSKNISLRLAQGDLNRAEAAQAGTYGRFLPVFSLEGTRTNNFTGERTIIQKNLLPDPEDSTEFVVQNVQGFVDRTQFDNNSELVGRVQLFLPTGATLNFSGNIPRDTRIPLYQEPPDPDNPADRNITPTTKQLNRSYAVNFTQPLLRDAGPTVARSAFLTTGYDRQLEEKNLLNQKLQTVFAVKRAYYIALLQRELIKVNLTALIKDSSLVEASKALIVARLATRRDVLSAEIRFADDRAAVIASRSDYELSLDRLKDEIGVPINMPIELDSTILTYAPVTLDVQTLVRQALENNPLVHNADIAINRSRLQRRIAKNALLPQLDFAASYSSNLERNLVSNLDINRAGGWAASLNLSYPFLSREEASKVEEAEIAVSQQEDRRLEIQRQIMIDVRDIVRGVYSAAAQLEAIGAGIKVAQDKLEFSTTMFNLGRASNFDITESQEFLLKAQNQYLRKLVDYHTQLALLESLIGKPITQ